LRFLNLAIIVICLTTALFPTAQGNCGHCGEGGGCSGPECGGSDPGGLYVDPIAFPDPNGYSNPGGPVTVSEGISITVTSPRSGTGSGTIWGPEGSTYSYPEPRHESCPPIPDRHLIRDMRYSYCVYMCDNGYQFDQNGDCVKVMPASASGSGTLVASTPTGSRELKPGDELILPPDGVIELAVNCARLVKLVKGTSGKNYGLGQAVNDLAGFPAVSALVSNLVHGEISPVIADAALMESKIRFFKSIIVCGKLYSGEYGRVAEAIGRLNIQSASRSSLQLGSSGSPGQIAFGLDQGPFLAEVVNDGTSLDIETDVLTASSKGNNTFGVIHDPINRISTVLAYGGPVSIKHRNYAIESVELHRGEAIVATADNLSSVIPFNLTSIDASQPTSYPGDTPPNQPPIRQDEDPMQKLKQIKEMLDLGLITQEDYDSKKGEILSKV